MAIKYQKEVDLNEKLGSKSKLSALTLPPIEIDDLELSESSDYLNQLPKFKKSCRNHQQKGKRIRLISNLSDSSTNTLENKIKTFQASMSSTSSMERHEDIIEERLLRQVTPKVFNYFSNIAVSYSPLNSASLSTNPRALNRVPKISTEMRENLLNLSLTHRANNLSTSSTQRNLFFPLLIRQQHNQTKSISAVPFKKASKTADPNGFFFVQSIAHLKPKQNLCPKS